MHLNRPRAACAALAVLGALAEISPCLAAEPSTEPALFGEGVVSTGEYESHPAFTPDGRTLYFVRSTPEFTDWTIYVAERSDGAWSAPRVASFSGRHRDADPFVTADGRQLYFISDRPVAGRPKDDMDIWVMDQTQSGDWGEPRNLGTPVNTMASEWFPTLTTEGTLYFGSGRPGGEGSTDLYRAVRKDGTFAEPVNLGSNVNSAADEYEGCIAPDESFLVFMAAGRPAGFGGGDLYISHRKDGEWTPARNLGSKINGPGLEISPSLSPDGRFFLFSSAREAADSVTGERPNRTQNGLGDIYQMELAALHEIVK